MTQSANIYAHMVEVGPITPLEAFELYGTLALHSRVAELRSRGIPIECTMIKVGEKRVGQYSLKASA